MPEQVNTIFASDEDNIPSLVFISKAEEKKAVIQWARFSNFNRLVNTLAYVQRDLSNYEPRTLLVSVEEKEKGKAIIFSLLQLEQFSEEMKSFKAENEIPNGSKILPLEPLLDEERPNCTKTRKSKSQLDFNAKHPILQSTLRHGTKRGSKNF